MKFTRCYRSGHVLNPPAIVSTYSNVYDNIISSTIYQFSLYWRIGLSIYLTLSSPLWERWLYRPSIPHFDRMGMHPDIPQYLRTCLEATIYNIHCWYSVIEYKCILLPFRAFELLSGHTPHMVLPHASPMSSTSSFPSCFLLCSYFAKVMYVNANINTYCINTGSCLEHG